MLEKLRHPNILTFIGKYDAIEYKPHNSNFIFHFLKKN